MTISVNLSGNIQPFNIGESDFAEKAIQSYQSYQTGYKYEDLRKCFAFLQLSMSHAQNKQNVCLASAALASSTLDLETDIYKKYFIATSVSSIIGDAKLEKSLGQIKAIWDSKSDEYGNIITSNLIDAKAAKAAGLVVMVGIFHPHQ